MNHLIKTGKESEIEKQIILLRGKQVILDRDLARLYEVEVSQMNRQVKRNIERFPDDFMFQITKEELNGLKCQNGISNSRGGDRSLPYAFTEQGVSMLAGLLRSSIAINANIAIIRAFTAMRRLITYNSDYFSRMEMSLILNKAFSSTGRFTTRMLLWQGLSEGQRKESY